MCALPLAICDKSSTSFIVVNWVSHDDSKTIHGKAIRLNQMGRWGGGRGGGCAEEEETMTKEKAVRILRNKLSGDNFILNSSIN